MVLLREGKEDGECPEMSGHHPNGIMYLGGFVGSLFRLE